MKRPTGNPSAPLVLTDAWLGESFRRALENEQFEAIARESEPAVWKAR